MNAKKSDSKAGADGMGPFSGPRVRATLQPSSGELRVGRIDTGRHHFFAEQVARLGDRLYGTALRLTRNSEDAEDLVAETVAKAWAKLGELCDPQSFEAWIQRILTNTFVSEWRHRRASPEVAMEPETEDDEGEPFSLFEKMHQPFLLWWATPEEEVIAKLLREDIDQALDTLPDVFRIAIVTVDVQGYSYAEAAGLLGVPIGTVRSRLARARAQLQRTLWRHAQDAGLLNHRVAEKDPNA